MVGRRPDYALDAVGAARSVLIELVHLLGEYRNHIVVVGGWVPLLILPNAADRHVGTLDVDLALDHRTIQEPVYKTIRELLLSREYREGSQPFMFYRDVTRGGRRITVRVDLLSREYGGTGRSHRTQVFQDLRARKARGSDLAFDLCSEVIVEGELPEGGLDSVVARVAGIVPFLVMKGMALRDRLKDKDAYDIYFCLANYPGGLDALVEAFEPHVNNGLVREALLIIKEKFASPDHVGSRSAADSKFFDDAEERAIRQQDAYQRVKYLLEKLGMA